MKNEILDDCKLFADKHRGRNKRSGPHWSTIIRFPKLYDEAVRLEKRGEYLEQYEKLNHEWVKEKVEGLNTFEEVEKMIMLAERLNKSNLSIRCGWCDAEFETREQVKEHAYGCEDNPLTQRIAELENENNRLSGLVHDEISQLEIVTDLGNRRWKALNEIYTDGERHNANWCKRKAKEGLGIK